MEDLQNIIVPMTQQDIRQHLNLTLVNELIDILADEFKQLIITFKTDSDSRIASINSSLKALNSTENHQDIAGKIAKKAHGFKGSASSMGAAPLFELCRELENKAKAHEFHTIAELMPLLRKEYDLVLSALLHAANIKNLELAN